MWPGSAGCPNCQLDIPPAGAIIGIFVGGRLADWQLMPSMLGATLAHAAVSAGIILAMHSPVAMFVLMIALGATVYTFTVPQTRIVHNSAGAQTLAATFIATAFNLGYALGALVGAALLTNGLGYPSLPMVGIATGVGAAVVTLISWRLDRRA